MKLLYLSVYVNEDELPALLDLLQNTSKLTPDPVPSLDWDSDADVCDDIYVCDTCKQLVDETQVYNAKSRGCCDCDAEFCSAECQTGHGRKTGHDIGHDDVVTG